MKSPVPPLAGPPTEAIGPKSMPGDSGNALVALRNELVASRNALLEIRNGPFGFRKELAALEAELSEVE
jgi:hypothetical protein